MTKKIFVMYDSKSESYDQPWFIQNRGIAIRSLLDEVSKNPDHPFKKWPEDFTLFEVGEYDNTNGTIQMYEAKQSIGTLNDILKIASPAEPLPQNTQLIQKKGKPDGQQKNLN